MKTVNKGRADVNAIDKDGLSLLDTSLEENNDWAGLFLITHNVSISDTGSSSGRMPLEIAIERGLVNTMKGEFVFCYFVSQRYYSTNCFSMQRCWREESTSTVLVLQIVRHCIKR